MEYDHIRGLVEKVPANHGEDILAHPLKPAPHVGTIERNGLQLSKLVHRRRRGLGVMSCAEGNHSRRIVMVLLFPWWVEVVIFKVRVTAVSHRTTKSHFAAQQTPNLERRCAREIITRNVAHLVR